MATAPRLPRLPRFPQAVDRSIARMVATKRIVTGTLALSAGIALLAVAAAHGGPKPLALGFALLIFFGGGTWSLRDGLRLHRDLRLVPTTPAPVAPVEARQPAHGDQNQG